MPGLALSSVTVIIVERGTSNFRTCHAESGTVAVLESRSSSSCRLPVYGGTVARALARRRLAARASTKKVSGDREATEAKCPGVLATVVPNSSISPGTSAS